MMHGHFLHKINRILVIILVGYLAIALRVWHLGVIQRDAKLDEAQKPQSRTFLQRPDRGPIYDRFGVPLALNRICYHAAVCYGQISQIAITQWKEGSDGKRIRSFPRKEYIQKLSRLMADLLQLDAKRIEDAIYSKASLFPHVPYILKAGISESEYYRLKGLECGWPGVHAEMTSERFYPLHRTGCHILGTMGAINRKQYREVAQEMVSLQETVDRFMRGEGCLLPKGYLSFESVSRRLDELKEKAYTLNDLVGKSGIEKQFEQELRGFVGKKIIEIDQKGRFLRELPGGKAAISGQQINLSISAELQQFAEELLILSEKEREGRSFGIDPADKHRKMQKQPWIKGGAIVAFDPNNGDVLAMASVPRFDPNDFVFMPRTEGRPANGSTKQRQIHRWLENPHYVGAIWDGREPLYRERLLSRAQKEFAVPDEMGKFKSHRQCTDEEVMLTWEFYLDQLLPQDGPLRTFFQKCDDLKGAIQVQEDFERFRYAAQIQESFAAMKELFGTVFKGQLDVEAMASKRRLEALLGPIPSLKDKLFAIDLCRVVVDSTRFSDELIAKIGSMKLNVYRDLCQKFLCLEKRVLEREKASFHSKEFVHWREENQKAFLLEHRKREKAMKMYAQAYLDYLDEKEKELFAEHWESKRFKTIASALGNEPKLVAAVSGLSPELVEEFLRTFRSFEQLDRSLLYPYQTYRIEQDLAAAFYPKGGFGSIRSYAFQTGAPQGSIFKLVTAYEGLRQGHFLQLIDSHGFDPKASVERQMIVAYAPNGSPYPRIYKGGRLPKSTSAQIGKIDIVGAIEHSSNPYFSILTGDFLSDPEDLTRAARSLGYGEKSGLELPGEIAGNLPMDLKLNRTNPYSFAIGQHTLLNTPLQSAVMLGALANGGQVLRPNIAKMISGFTPNWQALASFSQGGAFAERELKALGIPFPLFTGVKPRGLIPEAADRPAQVRKVIPLAPSIRLQIFEGMDHALWSSKGNARPGVIRSLRISPSLTPEYLSLQHQMIGKTSTAEIMYRPHINPSSSAQMYNHIWFGAISFDPDHPFKIRYDHPELVVVVFLRFGDAGKEAAPIAAQMVKKWREIKKKNRLERGLVSSSHQLATVTRTLL